MQTQKFNIHHLISIFLQYSTGSVEENVPTSDMTENLLTGIM